MHAHGSCYVDHLALKLSESLLHLRPQIKSISHHFCPYICDQSVLRFCRPRPPICVWEPQPLFLQTRGGRSQLGRPCQAWLAHLWLQKPPPVSYQPWGPGPKERVPERPGVAELGKGRISARSRPVRDPVWLNPVSWIFASCTQTATRGTKVGRGR